MSSAKYDIRVNPLYQIDFSVQASGKRLSATKRRVCFRFGFSNAEAIAQGLTGVECRGEEHEVVLVWSLASGKRFVSADEEEVHFSMGNRLESKFETSWSIAGGSILKLIAHATPPLMQTPGFRQFDLLLDGMSFFDMPKIYELGKTKASATAARAWIQRNGVVHSNSILPDHSAEESHTSANWRERRDSSFSLPPARRTQEHIMSMGSIDNGYDYERRAFEDSHAANMAERPASESDAMFAEQESASSTAPDLLFDTIRPQSNDLLGASSGEVLALEDEYSPVPARPETPSFDMVANQIMSSYDTTTPPAPKQQYPTISNESQTHFHTTPFASPSSVTQYPPASSAAAIPTVGFYRANASPPPYPPAPHYEITAFPPTYEASFNSESAANLTMDPLDLHELEAREQPAVSSHVDRAVQNLVHLGDIMDFAESPEERTTNQKKLGRESSQSMPLPPSTTNWHVSSNASLSDIQMHSQPRSDSKEVMRTYEYNNGMTGQSGAMMVHGGSVDIPRTNGFGAGFQQQQQQQEYYYHYYAQGNQPSMITPNVC